jgi:hypothetical protein
MTTAAAAPAAGTAAAGATSAAPSTATATQTPAAPAALAAPAAPAATGAPAAPAAAPEAALISEAPPAVEAFELRVPEGVKADESLMKEFGTLAKGLGMKSADAQKIVDIYATRVEAQAKAADEAFAKQQGAWKDEVKADKEIGGQNFDQTRVEVGRFFNAFDKDGSVRKAISQLGLGNHPAIVRLAVRAAKLLREDGVVAAGAPGGERSEEDKLRSKYPSMFPKQ